LKQTKKPDKKMEEDGSRLPWDEIEKQIKRIRKK